MKLELPKVLTGEKPWGSPGQGMCEQLAQSQKWPPAQRLHAGEESCSYSKNKQAKKAVSFSKFQLERFRVFFSLGCFEC
jgi:hypothetical protein